MIRSSMAQVRCPLAEVTLIEPSQELLVLRVENPEYILRSPIQPDLSENDTPAPRGKSRLPGLTE